jgi:hypothetical protein
MTPEERKALREAAERIIAVAEEINAELRNDSYMKSAGLVETKFAHGILSLLDALSSAETRLEKARTALNGCREIKPMPQEKLEEILEYEELTKTIAFPGGTRFGLSWADQQALINEAILAHRAREATAP